MACRPFGIRRVGHHSVHGRLGRRRCGDKRCGCWSCRYGVVLCINYDWRIGEFILTSLYCVAERGLWEELARAFGERGGAERGQRGANHALCE